MKSARQGIILALLLATVSGPVRGAMAVKAPDACALLEAADIAAVQEAKLIETKASEDQEGKAAVRQCFFRTEPVARSISLRWVSAPEHGDADAARERWQAVFHGEHDEAEGGEKEREEEEGSPPQPVAGLGDEAFWTGDAASGALYVLSGKSFLRISIGGVSDAAARLEKTKRVAQAALRRLPRRR